jgi:hypothetical protein
VRLSPVRAGALVAAAAFLVVVLWGGYGRHWPWTGINGQTATLWDWLHLLLLPMAFGLLPLLLSRERRLRPEHRAAGLAAVIAVGVIVVAGYTIPWSWTGFEGNKLWDWLELLALPLAVALIPIVPTLRVRWRNRHTLIALVCVGAFAGIVIAGYVGGWSWTGFRGNTLWDWLHLLLLPLLLPTVIVPALRPFAAARMIEVGDETQAPAGEPSPPLEEPPQPLEETQVPLEERQRSN